VVEETRQHQAEEWQEKHRYGEEQLERAYATILALEERAQDAEGEKGCIESAHELERKHLAKRMAKMEETIHAEMGASFAAKLLKRVSATKDVHIW